MTGRAVVASANTICSCTVLTFPHELASLSVDEEHAPSRTSATVICTAYLCTGTSVPRISAATTVSWAKFFGTPPPIIRSPDSLLAILIWVSSRKSFTDSMLTWFLGFFHWCEISPNPADESENAVQKIGTSISYAVCTRESFFLECFVKYRPISRINSREEYGRGLRPSAIFSIVLSQF